MSIFDTDVSLKLSSTYGFIICSRCGEIEWVHEYITGTDAKNRACIERELKSLTIDDWGDDEKMFEIMNKIRHYVLMLSESTVKPNQLQRHNYGSTNELWLPCKRTFYDRTKLCIELVEKTEDEVQGVVWGFKHFIIYTYISI